MRGAAPGIFPFRPAPTSFGRGVFLLGKSAWRRMKCAFAIRPKPSAASAVFFRPLCVLRRRGRFSQTPLRRFSLRPQDLPDDLPYRHLSNEPRRLFGSSRPASAFSPTGGARRQTETGESLGAGRRKQENLPHHKDGEVFRHLQIGRFQAITRSRRSSPRCVRRGGSRRSTPCRDAPCRARRRRFRPRRRVPEWASGRCRSLRPSA